jgi:citrate lyase subunit beta / citryl-CoA lyase
VPTRHIVLSVPASSDKLVAKGRTLEVDEVLLDLEDAVRTDDKEAARERVLGALAQGPFACGHVTVRVNGHGTPWFAEDLRALAAAGFAGSVVVPKVEAPEHLAAVDALLEGTPIRTQALVESAAGLARVQELAGASDRVEGLVLGYADLAASLGRSTAMARDLSAWAPAQHAVLLAARAHGIAAIDGPWLGTQVDEPFLASAATAAGLGFDGKWAIHPQQLPALREAFAPTAEEVEWARRVLAALDAADGGAVDLDGQMLDEALAVGARRTLAKAGEAA